jgi:monoamine oxidase
MRRRLPWGGISFAHSNWLCSLKEYALKYDVIILGGGLAGLTAASRLAKNGARVVVLEARAGVGGRVRTYLENYSSCPIEGGAEFVHGTVPELDDAARQTGVTLTDIEDEHHIFVDGMLSSFDFGKSWQRIGDRLTAYKGPDISFCQFMYDHCHDLPARDQMLARSYVEGFNAANAKDVSSHWLRVTDAAVGAGGGAPKRIVEGYSRIVDFLAGTLAEQGVDIRLNAQAKRVDWKPGRVSVDCYQAETILAECAIVTLPLGVLQSSSLQFVPDIPDVRDLWCRLKMGAVVKIVLSFEERLWPGGISFVHAPEEMFETWWTTAICGSYLLTGWVGGPRAADLSKHSPAAVFESALDLLARVLGVPEQTAKASLHGWRLFNWQADPFSCGAYIFAAWTASPFFEAEH